MEKEAKIFIAGSHTLIGRSVLKILKQRGYNHIIDGTQEGLNLIDPHQVEAFFARERPEYIFLVAGKSGGIWANQKYPAGLMLNNLLIQCHVIHNAYRYGVKKLLFLASSCCYPRNCQQPMQEKEILSGPLEVTSEAYALAKITGLKMCQAYRQQYGVNFITGIPANVFGPGDDFSPKNSHVIPSLIMRMYEAKLNGNSSVVVWGSGSSKREFIYSLDLADACIFIMNYYDGSEPINIGTGFDISIKELAYMIREVVGYSGKIRFDSAMPEGMPLKSLDSTRIREMGWHPKFSFLSALRATFEWFLQRYYRSPLKVEDQVSGEDICSQI